jgi:hypothetical protein
MFERVRSFARDLTLDCSVTTRGDGDKGQTDVHVVRSSIRYQLTPSLSL